MQHPGQVEGFMSKDERRMTFIVVPHGGRDLSTRSFEVSYRRLRAAGLLLLAATLLWVVMAVSWVYVASQAARVPGLRQEVARLEAEQERVGQLASALRRLEAQYLQVREMLGANRPSEPGSIWLPPVGGARGGEAAPDPDQAAVPSAWPLTQRGFVTREHLGRIPGQHPGIDIAIAEGSYVRTAAPGLVTQAGEDRIYGRFVRIRHDEGYETLYGHASELFVVENDSVGRHTVIALSGNTGTSTAPHLHFEIWKDGEPIDPRSLVQPPQ
jgi:murein DD-endopeptidase MepM/ murein hydrolase activator NlpD